MSETRFTPGPWHVEIDSECGAVIVQPGRGEIACGWMPPEDGKRREPDIHDARLMAAAPELFAALLAVVPNFIDGEPCWCIGEDADEDLEHTQDCIEAKRALSKARGESPDRGNRARGK